MHPDAITEQTKSVLEKIGNSRIGENFYLGGGTALALQIGHRESMDLDWFSQEEFLNSRLKNELSGIGEFRLENESQGTINGLLDGVRVSFFYYPYKLSSRLVSFEKINLASKQDIAAMKIDAVSSRGSKKDFIDLYFLLKEFSLKELIQFFEEKYSGIKYNKLHILKSLSYFEDAEEEPMPKMIKDISWEEVKKYLQKETESLI